LLTDVNQDLMGGKGIFYENLASRPEERYPHLPTPNVCLIYNQPNQTPCSISLALAPQGEFIRIRASLYATLVQWRDVPPDKMETALRSLLVWLIEEGMREIWFAQR
jgi:hypothetical protein